MFVNPGHWYGHPVTTTGNLKEWEREHALRIRASVNKLRERRGWSISRLRDELERYGWDISLNTLNGVLSSQKRSSFTTGEVLTFAAALEVSPTYLLLGLPDTSDFPSSPIAPDPDVSSMWGWLSGRGFRGALAPMYFGPLEKFAEAVSYARWHNALWLASGGSVGADELQRDLADIANWHSTWEQYVEGRRDVPDVPVLPEAIRAAVQYMRNLKRGEQAAQKFGPFGDFSSDAWMDAARTWLDALRASEQWSDRG